MATIVSQPGIFVSALRGVKYVFNMPSIGVAPEKKYLIYMLKVNGVNAYQEYKVYNPVVNGQDIEIDFTNDLRGLVQSEPPPFGLPPTMFSSVNIITQITVEYGERTINTETCEDPVDEIEGETEPIDVLNGINRPYQNSINSTYQILSKRPSIYTIRPDSEDFLYVTGTLEVSVSYYGGSGFLISTIVYNSTETHPGAVVNIIPVGFNGAPAGAISIKVYVDQLVSPSNPTGLLYQISGEDCGCQDGVPVDLYVQNNFGGTDLLVFDCVDVMNMDAVKQQAVNRHDSGLAAVLQQGQRRFINNNSLSTISFKKTFQDIDFNYALWLNELVASNNAWLRLTHENGAELIIRMQIQPSSVQTYGEDTELVLNLIFSEVELYPY